MNPEDQPVMGKHALYSVTEKRPFTCTVECSSCREETRVSYVELGALLFPLHFHVPFVKYHHSWFKCPACGTRTWMRVHLDR
ncbi:MAG: hypothetical protein M3285_06765 [Actinomycetota bacterium]|nr:hypothetical protein [Actinomycetota bacterium]